MGELAARFFRLMSARPPRLWGHQARQILLLCERFSTADLDAALGHAASFGAFDSAAHCSALHPCVIWNKAKNRSRVRACGAPTARRRRSSGVCSQRSGVMRIVHPLVHTSRRANKLADPSAATVGAHK
jgi:hypothetical protein